MKESEAREMWCPFSGKHPTVYDQYAALVSFCIASDCMAWRVKKYYGVEMTGADEKVTKVGYCGLAGKP